MLTLLSKSVVSASTRLSVVAVMGLAALFLLPLDAVSTMGAATREPTGVAIEVIPAKPVLLAEDAPGGPAFQLAGATVEAKAGGLAGAAAGAQDVGHHSGERAARGGEGKARSRGQG